MQSVIAANHDSPLPGWSTRVFSLRPRLDTMIRRWRLALPGGQEGARLWEMIRAEVEERARKGCRRYDLAAHEVEDLQQEVLFGLWKHLQDPGAREVRDYDAYVKAVISNAARRTVRRSRPVWNALKDEVVETLRGRRGVQGFAIWRDGTQELAGYGEWAGRHADFGGSDRYFELQADLRPLRRAVQSRVDPERAALPLLIQAILDWLRVPLPVNELTALVFELRGCRERREEPLPDHESAAPVHGSPESDALRGELMTEIGRAFMELPPPRCAAFLFHLAPQVAERLLEAVSPGNGGRDALRRLADHLKLPADELERTLDELPWPDLRIADFLGLPARDASNAKKDNHDRQMKVVHLRRGAAQAMQKHLAALDGPSR